MSSRFLVTLAFLAACGGDESNPVEMTPENVIPAGERYEGCTKLIPKSSDYEKVQTTLIEARTGDVICFEDGTYAFDTELSLTVNAVTLRGNPQDRSKVVLDYTNQSEGKDALSVSGSDFTIEHLTIRNSRGNSVIVKGAERPTFRNLKVYWDAGSSTDNGAYAVYPVSCTDVLVEDCEVIGASDAGIYVGQSKRIIVRNNVVHGNVAGIEIENSDDALVTGNRVYDNTAGILVFVMPNLEKTDGSRTIVENNIISDNNRKNFAEAGTTVSFVPQGLGLLLLSNDGTEVRSNTIEDNGTTGVLAVSFSTYEFMCQAGGGDNCGARDPNTDPDASKTYIHDNTFMGNGAAPDPGIVDLFPGIDPIEDVLWDGREPEAAQDEDQFCVGDGPVKLRVIGDQNGLWIVRTVDITDATKFACTLPPPFAKLELPQDK
jgi:parallel beta-helix repeat protein